MVLAGVLAGCGTEPGTLIITADALPALTPATELTVTGSVSRNPPATTSIVVSASGGLNAPADSADETGRFSLALQLRPNMVNSITLTAADGTGSTSVPVVLTITQDGVAPTVASMSPQGDGVATNITAIQIGLSEPVVLSGLNAGAQVVRGFEVVSGVSFLSADSLTLTFSPSQALKQNSVYSVVLVGVADRAGNLAAPAADACFVTQVTAPAMVVETDSTGDILVASATGISPSDLVEFRLAVVGGELTGVLKYTTPRSYDTTATNNVVTLIELDTDQDSTTGYRTFKDSLYVVGGLGTQFSSGTRVEYVIGIDPYPLSDTPELAGLSYVGEYIDQFIFNLTDAYLPGFCGEFVGIVTTLSALGGDEGNINYTILNMNFEGVVGLAADAAPSSGHWTTAFAGMFGPVVSAPALGSQGPRGAVFRLQPRLLRPRR
jgi:hypothetical protein